MSGEKYFTVMENGKFRNYLMPGIIPNIRAMKDHIREQFPMEDQSEIFGLHGSATRKAVTDIASDIMHRTYIYQFVIKKPKRPQLTSDQATRHDQMVYEYYRQKLLTILYEVPLPMPPEEYEEAIPIDRDRCFNTLLVKEIQRYNTLIEAIRKNLNNTLAVMEGLQ